MRKIEKKIINETIENKIDDLMSKVKGKMDEVDVQKPKRPMVKQEKNPKLRKVEKPKRPMVKQEDNPDYVKDTKPKRPMVKQEKNPKLNEFDSDQHDDMGDDVRDTVEAAMKKLRDIGYTTDGENGVDDSIMETVQDIVSEIKIREFKGKKRSKNSVIMSESELISFIKELVTEESKANGIKEVDRVKKTNNSEAESYLKELAKKLKNYASVDVKKETKTFPDRNKTGETKARRNSKEEEEFIDDFAKNGVEAFIKPEDYDKNRNKEYVEGSSETGNSDEYANSVKTDVNKNIGNKIKKGALRKEKMKSYNKDPQPVTNVKESLKKEFERINEMIYYNKKTQ